MNPLQQKGIDGQRYAWVEAVALGVPRGHRWWRRPTVIERDLGGPNRRGIVERVDVDLPWTSGNVRWAHLVLGDFFLLRKLLGRRPPRVVRVSLAGARKRGRPQQMLIAFMVEHPIADWAYAFDISKMTLRRALAAGKDIEDVLLTAERRQRSHRRPSTHATDVHEGQDVRVRDGNQRYGCFTR